MVFYVWCDARWLGPSRYPITIETNKHRGEWARFPLGRYHLNGLKAKRWFFVFCFLFWLFDCLCASFSFSFLYLDIFIVTCRNKPTSVRIEIQISHSLLMAIESAQTFLVIVYIPYLVVCFVLFGFVSVLFELTKHSMCCVEREKYEWRDACVQIGIQNQQISNTNNNRQQTITLTVWSIEPDNSKCPLFGNHCILCTPLLWPVLIYEYTYTWARKKT